MLSLHFGPFLVVWNEMSFMVPSKVPDHPGIPGLLYKQMFWSGVGEEGAAHGLGTPGTATEPRERAQVAQR